MTFTDSRCRSGSRFVPVSTSTFGLVTKRWQKKLMTFTSRAQKLHPLLIDFAMTSFVTKCRMVGMVALSIFAVWITLSLGTRFFWCVVSLTWPTIPAHVTSSALSTGESNAGQWWRPEVAYAYQLDGQSYTSRGLRLMMPFYYHEQDARQIQEEYPAGAQVRAAYNPRKPTQSVLEPGIPPGMWWRAFIPLFFWTVVGYLYYEIRHPERRVVLLPDLEAAGQD
jgi:Protein of unknown function (DUF3592)